MRSRDPTQGKTFLSILKTACPFLFFPSFASVFSDSLPPRLRDGSIGGKAGLETRRPSSATNHLLTVGFHEQPALCLLKFLLAESCGAFRVLSNMPIFLILFLSSPKDSRNQGQGKKKKAMRIGPCEVSPGAALGLRKSCSDVPATRGLLKHSGRSEGSPQPQAEQPTEARSRRKRNEGNSSEQGCGGQNWKGC